MAKVIGLSHLVFTVGYDSAAAQGSAFMNVFYSEGARFEFDHSEARMPLLRTDCNSISRLSFFAAKDSDMPAVELLHVQPSHERDHESYGIIILDRALAGGSPAGTKKLTLANYFLEVYFDDFLQSYICTKTDLPIAGARGCWIKAIDFAQQKAFLSSIASCKILLNEENVFAVNAKVVNRRFSDFVVVLFRDEEDDATYYNDDTGLSTLGWIIKDIDAKTESKLENESASLTININQNYFNAKFLYNNKSISHELLQKQ